MNDKLKGKLFRERREALTYMARKKWRMWRGMHNNQEVFVVAADESHARKVMLLSLCPSFMAVTKATWSDWLLNDLREGPKDGD